MRATDGYSAANISATTAAFTLAGGRYAASVVATFGGGTVNLQMLGPDGSTYIDLKQAFDKPDAVGGTEEDLVIGTFAAAGLKVFDLPSGSYRLTIATASAVYASIARVPLE